MRIDACQQRWKLNSHSFLFYWCMYRATRTFWGEIEKEIKTISKSMYMILYIYIYILRDKYDNKVPAGEEDAVHVVEGGLGLVGRAVLHEREALRLPSHVL